MSRDFQVPDGFKLNVMKTLSQQLIELNTQAIGIIKSVIPKHFASIDDIMRNPDDDCLTADFKESACMITDNINGENEDYYLLGITGNEHECKISVVTEFGNMYSLDVFELEVSNILIIADFITK